MATYWRLRLQVVTATKSSSKRTIHNAIELVTKRAYPFIYSNIADIEKTYTAKSMAQIPSQRSMSG